MTGALGRASDGSDAFIRAADAADRTAGGDAARIAKGEQDVRSSWELWTVSAEVFVSPLEREFAPDGGERAGLIACQRMSHALGPWWGEQDGRNVLRERGCGKR